MFGKDIQGDGVDEYLQTPTAKIHVKITSKETVTISGLTYANKAYTGEAYTPTGTLAVSGNLVPVSELEVSFKGRGLTVYNSTTAPTNAGTYQVTYSVPATNENYTGSITYAFEIEKVEPVVVLPTNLKGAVGNDLITVNLPIEWFWDWTGHTIVAGEQTVLAIYTPDDFMNYKQVERDLIVTGLEAYVVITFAGENGTISGGTFEIFEGETFEITVTPDTGYVVDKVMNGSEDITDQLVNNKLTLTINDHYYIDVTFKLATYTVEVTGKVGTVVSPVGKLTVDHGGSQVIDLALAPKGYKSLKVLVNGVDKTADIVAGQLTITNITKNTTVVVSAEVITYKIIEGANQEYKIEVGKDARFVANGDFSLFEKVFVDSVELLASQYKVEAGSTVVILNEAYIKTLALGKHTLSVVYSDGGVANTVFTITKATTTPVTTPGTKTPLTNDTITVYLGLLIFSIVGTAITVVILKKKQRA